MSTSIQEILRLIEQLEQEELDEECLRRSLKSDPYIEEI